MDTQKHMNSISDSFRCIKQKLSVDLDEPFMIKGETGYYAINKDLEVMVISDSDCVGVEVISDYCLSELLQ